MDAGGLVTDGRDRMDIRAVQEMAWRNKLAKGFNTTDAALEFCLLHGEVAEAFDAWRNGGRGLGPELADVVIFAAGLAQMTGIDLRDEVAAKIALNAARSYRREANGVLVKKPGNTPAADVEAKAGP
jgi:NTP pyrophosphatase (non-canonical NTP hydrolase)